ncbi:uncharacterized protein LOC116141744 [Pistacia vera]|uniref:uncharacterized protein LOC116141744 n=1 Tax=Pistacia vera TaxID=55513 RepID=UPI0012635121|nr:uncharacterized protein LOC116141744 [Pistacia vera]XP_031283092.1 uncharacterized protein LOC116141744 [Pistacia vera]
MSGDNFTDGLRPNRPALGDVTNRPVKRAVSLISGDLGPKSGDSENGNSGFAKKVCLQVENLVKEMSKNKKSGVDNSEKGVSLCENVVSIVSNEPDKIDKSCDLGVTIAHNGVELGEASRDCCVSSVLMPTCSKKGCEEGVGAQVGRVSNDKDVGVGRLASSKCGSIEWSRLPKSQGLKSFELERCAGLKDDGCVNLNVGADMLKDCSCSFCLKAAYIWSDLHYQDIKGRIAALKKSQKEASCLVQKCVRGKELEIPGQGSSGKSSKLESDLMSQWRSLFSHMEDIFGHESSQLQASFVTLKDLRENCKMDLERTNGMPSEKH